MITRLCKHSRKPERRQVCGCRGQRDAAPSCRFFAGQRTTQGACIRLGAASEETLAPVSPFSRLRSARFLPFDYRGKEWLRNLKLARTQAAAERAARDMAEDSGLGVRSDAPPSLHFTCPL
ncbi:hypothetical protein EYF80_026223 [Liparis tanakae]|uniref:Uncharacterized protein n=1 Tax=Liparis tanakae TaxID=230148 RepID=A0A4Z2HD59_9TELE|nr:hypothetical protein EYF80_026223 [Liparis tanakae]